jgi:hypothetical protein
MLTYRSEDNELRGYRHHETEKNIFEKGVTQKYFLFK